MKNRLSKQSKSKMFAANNYRGCGNVNGGYFVAEGSGTGVQLYVLYLRNLQLSNYLQFVFFDENITC